MTVPSDPAPQYPHCMRILFASAELAPVAQVGGLAEAGAGLINELRRLPDVEIDVILPDYGDVEMSIETEIELTVEREVPNWSAPARARTGQVAGVGRITLVSTPGLARPGPYTDGAGRAWPDNDRRFFGFSAAVAALIARLRPDVVHLNDWHTAAVLGHLDPLDRPPVVLTVHTLGYQGTTDSSWLETIPHQRELFEWYGGTNPLAGGLSLADRVIAVSPTYADEIRQADGGMGLHHRLTALGDRLIGIRNGIDVDTWNPAEDSALTTGYDHASLAGKQSCRIALSEEIGWPVTDRPLIGAVTRLVDQKGTDILLDSVRYLAGIGARLVLLGAGEQGLADRARQVSEAHPDNFAFVEGHRVDLAHRILAGADLFAMPSRFEPCGLAQMQAMVYGTIPVVSPVGGLLDTVCDADLEPDRGTGFVMGAVNPTGLVDALHRAVRAVNDPVHRASITARAMGQDWSWAGPAQAHLAVYREAITERAGHRASSSGRVSAPPEPGSSPRR